MKILKHGVCRMSMLAFLDQMRIVMGSWRLEYHLTQPGSLKTWKGVGRMDATAFASLTSISRRQQLSTHHPHPHKLVDLLFERKVVQFGKFRLKLHETNPDAPLSPIYFNLRTPDNPKPGPLTDDILEMITDEFVRLADQWHIPFDAVGGIPNAGTPFAERFVRAAHPTPRLVHLVKEEKEGKRRIARVEENIRGQRLLLLDDLVTGADTKNEAIQAVMEGKGLVAAILVLIDREQGGMKELLKKGHCVKSVFTVSSLLRHFEMKGYIPRNKREEVEEYLKTQSVNT